MRTMKALLLGAGLAAMAAGLLGCRIHQENEGSAGSGVSAHGALWVNGPLLTGSKGETVVLRGASSHGIAWYPRYLNGRAMNTMKAYGANVQRLAMYTETAQGYLQEPEQNLNYLYMGMESALAADLYVIVDWHILEDGNPNDHVKEAEVFFEEVSRRYGNNPGILYEICNEPNGDTDWEDIKNYSAQVIPVIRENAPDAVILVGTPGYCTDLTGPIGDPLDFKNIMYTMHRYIDVSEPKPCDNWNLESAVKQKLPVFVSEWGTAVGNQAFFYDGEFDSGQKTYQENAQPFLDYMEKHQISWTAWSLSNKNEAHSILKSGCEKYSGWVREDLTDFGRLVFTNFK